MDSTTQVFTGNYSLDILDFYPDDLPEEWRFDYYSTNNFALMLGFNTNEDLEGILEDIDEDFKLVIDITGIKNIVDFDTFINPLKKHKDNFTLFANNLNKDIVLNIKDYNFCIKSETTINNCKKINDLYFNNFVVYVEKIPTIDLEVKNIIESALKDSGNIIFIQLNNDKELLEKTKIISELLTL